jgi:hypothetical protein
MKATVGAVSERTRTYADQVITTAAGDRKKTCKSRKTDLRERGRKVIWAFSSAIPSNHATAWGVAAFLAAGVAVPLYFIRYWVRRRVHE